jgi:hypothetical protein
MEKSKKESANIYALRKNPPKYAIHVVLDFPRIVNCIK